MSKFTKDVEKKSKEHEDQLACISQSFDPLSDSMSNHEDQVISLLDKIKSLSHDRKKIVSKVGELQSHITPKLDIFLSALKDAQVALATSEPSDLKSTETQAYLFDGLIYILECLKKGWDSHLGSLKNTFADIFKFL